VSTWRYPEPGDCKTTRNLPESSSRGSCQSSGGVHERNSPESPPRARFPWRGVCRRRCEKTPGFRARLRASEKRLFEWLVFRRMAASLWWESPHQVAAISIQRRRQTRRTFILDRKKAAVQAEFVSAYSKALYDETKVPAIPSRETFDSKRGFPVSPRPAALPGTADDQFMLLDALFETLFAAPLPS
jgi:hypothetical protein